MPTSKESEYHPTWNIFHPRLRISPLYGVVWKCYRSLEEGIQIGIIMNSFSVKAVIKPLQQADVFTHRP